MFRNATENELVLVEGGLSLSGAIDWLKNHGSALWKDLKGIAHGLSEAYSSGKQLLADLGIRV